MKYVNKFLLQLQITVLQILYSKEINMYKLNLVSLSLKSQKTFYCKPCIGQNNERRNLILSL